MLKVERHSNENIIILLIGSALLLAALFFAQDFLPIVLLTAVIIFLLGIFYIKPEVGIYLMAFCLPITDWLFNYKSLSASLIELLSLLVLLAYGLKILDPVKLKKNRWPVFAVFILFFGASVISSLEAQYIIPSVWYSVRWFLLLYLAYIFLPYNVILNARILKYTVIFLSLSGFLVAIMGVSSLSYQDSYSALLRIKPVSIGGVYLIGNNQNSLAEFLVMSSFMVLALKYWFRNHRARKILNLIFLFMVVVAIGTFSRTAWITLTLQGIFYFSYDFFFIKNKRLQSKEIILGLLLILILSVPLANRMMTLQEANVGSTASRLLLTKISWQAFLNHPVLGYGPGSFVNLVANNLRFGAMYGDPLDSHGLGQKLIAELGFLGLATFSLFCFIIFRKFYQALQKYPKQIKLLLPLIVGAGGGFFFQFFSTSYYKGKVWFPIALTLIAIKLIKERHDEYEKSKN